MAEAYGTRPSELLGVSDHWLSYCLDEAVFVRRQVALEKNRPGGRRFAPQGYDPPPAKVRAQIPWHGDGPDPLRDGGPS